MYSKNFLLQNVVRADIFTGSLAVFNKERGEAAPNFWGLHRRRRRRKTFELSLI
ncbi:MAG: hypothetical protein KGZ86_05275 [Candidatus Latescibacteria bacterium]|nr:hypothetical protein [Candidatus Latescibacterota bacterium]